MNIKTMPSFPEESVSIEYITYFSPQIGSTICAFLNTIGGKVFMGIDENGNVVDVDDKTIKSIRDLLNSHINPDPNHWIKIEKENWYGNELSVISVSAPQDNILFTYKGNYYYRQEEKNRVLIPSKDVEERIRRNKRIVKGQAVFIDYTPDGKNSATFERDKKNNKVFYKRIGFSSQDSPYFYKYLSLDTVLTIFLKDYEKKKSLQTMRFVEPPSWDDQFESHFYTADFSRVTKDKNAIPKMYATCFTPREESEPAWQVYNRGKEGLGKRCVQLCLNPMELRKELVKNLNNCTIVEGPVEYKSKKLIKTLHLSTDKDDIHSTIYDEYFSDFSLEKYLNLMLLKRTAYEHEQEIRIFIIYDDDKLGRKAKNKENASHKDISLDWLTMLEGIRVDPECTNIEMHLLQEAVYKLIDNSGKNKNDKKVLKEKLIVTKYNVYEDEDRNNVVVIGETYKDYIKRRNKRLTTTLDIDK